MANLTITISMDKKCAECGKGGAVDNGLCLKCTGRMMNGKPMKSEIGKAVLRRFHQIGKDLNLDQRDQRHR